MTDTTEPTICKECKHPVDTHKDWQYWKCGASVKSKNYVTDNGDVEHYYCTTHNDNGHCPDYAPAADAPQAEGDPANPNPECGDLDELNAAVDRGEA